MPRCNPRVAVASRPSAPGAGPRQPAPSRRRDAICRGRGRLRAILRGGPGASHGAVPRASSSLQPCLSRISTRPSRGRHWQKPKVGADIQGDAMRTRALRGRPALFSSCFRGLLAAVPLPRIYRARPSTPRPSGMPSGVVRARPKSPVLLDRPLAGPRGHNPQNAPRAHPTLRRPVCCRM